MAVSVSRWPYTAKVTMDPDSVLDYALDWSNWLQEGEQLTDAEWEVENATVVASSIEDSTDDEGEVVKTNAVAVVWLSEAEGTVAARCRVTTDSDPVARVDDRTLIFKVAEK